MADVEGLVPLWGFRQSGGLRLVGVVGAIGFARVGLELVECRHYLRPCRQGGECDEQGGEDSFHGVNDICFLKFLFRMSSARCLVHLLASNGFFVNCRKIRKILSNHKIIIRIMMGFLLLGWPKRCFWKIFTIFCVSIQVILSKIAVLPHRV